MKTIKLYGIPHHSQLQALLRMKYGIGHRYANGMLFRHLALDPKGIVDTADLSTKKFYSMTLCDDRDMVAEPEQYISSMQKRVTTQRRKPYDKKIMASNFTFLPPSIPDDILKYNCHEIGDTGSSNTEASSNSEQKYDIKANLGYTENIQMQEPAPMAPLPEEHVSSTTHAQGPFTSINMEVEDDDDQQRRKPSTKNDDEKDFPEDTVNMDNASLTCFLENVSDPVIVTKAFLDYTMAEESGYTVNPIDIMKACGDNTWFATFTNLARNIIPTSITPATMTALTNYDHDEGLVIEIPDQDDEVIDSDRSTNIIAPILHDYFPHIFASSIYNREPKYIPDNEAELLLPNIETTMTEMKDKTKKVDERRILLQRMWDAWLLFAVTNNYSESVQFYNRIKSLFAEINCNKLFDKIFGLFGPSRFQLAKKYWPDKKLLYRRPLLNMYLYLLTTTVFDINNSDTFIQWIMFYSALHVYWPYEHLYNEYDIDVLRRKRGIKNVV